MRHDFKKRWIEKENRRRATGWLIEKTGKSAHEISAKDFIENGLSGLLRLYNGSRVDVFRDNGFNINEWEMSRIPRGFFDRRNNRKRALEWFIEKTGKGPEEIEYADFEKFGFLGLLSNHYSNSIYDAFTDVGVDFLPWKRAKVRKDYWKEKDNRVKAVIWLERELGKHFTQITQKDFRDNGLGGLLSHYYNDCTIEAFAEAGHVLEPWERKRTLRTFWQEKQNKVRAVRWLVEKLRKPIREITQKDFKDNGLDGMLRGHYSGSPWRAIMDADYYVEPEEMQHNVFGGRMVYQSGHEHWFRSMAERDLDDVFFQLGLIDHIHNVKYPGSNYNCDFVFFERYWVEFAGLLGKGTHLGKESYEDIIEKKKQMARENNLDLTIITWDDYLSGQYLTKISHLIKELYAN